MIKPPVNIKQMSKISVHICKCWTDIVQRKHCFHLGLMFSTRSLVSDIRPYPDCHIILTPLLMNSRCNSWHCMSDPMADSRVLLETMCIYGIWQHRVFDTKNGSLKGITNETFESSYSWNIQMQELPMKLSLPHTKLTHQLPFKCVFLTIDCQTGSEWLIHGTNRSNKNQVLILKNFIRLSLVENVAWIWYEVCWGYLYS